MKEELTPEAIGNLSNLLIGTDTSSVEVGLEILLQYTDYIHLFEKELTLLAYMPQENNTLNEKSKVLLEQYFEEDDLADWEAAFAWVELRNILYDYEDFEENWNVIEAHTVVLQEYESLLLRNNRYLRYYLHLGERIMRYYPKRLDVAKAFFEMILKANKKDIETLNTLGGLYKEGLNDYKKALECYDTVLAIDPKNKEALNEKAYVFIHYFPKDQIDRAIVVLEEAIGYYPKDYNIKVWLADALMYKNTPITFEKGIELLEEAIAHTPNKSFAWIIYGNRIWITAQKPLEAEQIYKDGLKHNPYSCALMGNLAELYDNVHQDYEQAAKYYKEALELNPRDNFHLVNYIALLVIELDDLVEAHLRYQDLQRLHYQSIQPDPEMTTEQWAKFEKAQEELLKQYPTLADF